MKMHAFAALVAAFSLLSSGLFAQTRVVDSQGSVWAGAGGAQWQLAGSEVVVTDDVARKGASGLSQITLATGMHTLPGARCLFCGIDAAGHGRAELWQFSATGALGSLALLDSRVDVGRNYVGVAVASGAIYLLDSGADVLLSGSWDGTSALGNIGLSVAAQGATPNFPNPDGWTLTTLADGGVAMVPFPVGPGIRVVPGAGGQVALAPLALTGGHDAYAIPVRASEGDLHVTAVAVNSTVFEIVRIGVGVIGVGVGAGVNNEVSVPLSEPLLLGEKYVARVFGQATPTQYAFECVRRYGQSEVLSDGTLMQPFFYLTGATSGSTFNIQLALKSQLNPTAKQYVGSLLVGFRFPSDPVLPLPDGRFLLSTALTLQAGGWVLANNTQGSIANTVPIPPGLSDFVFLVQYVIYDGIDFRLSQIYGAEIR